MKKLLVTSVFLAASPALSGVINPNELPADFSVFEFNVNLGNGHTVTGSYAGRDVNEDGFISSYTAVDLGPLFQGQSEVALIRATYSGPNPNLVGTFDFYPTGSSEIVSDIFEADNGGQVSANQYVESALVMRLDGTGTIGDDNFGGSDFMNLRLTDEYVATSGSVPVSLVDPFVPPGGFTDYCEAGQSCSGLWRYEPVVVYVDEEGRPSDPGADPDGEIFLDGFVQASSNNGSTQVTSGPLGDALGVTETTALLPTGGDAASGFQFEAPQGAGAGQVFFIDPDVAVGYTYEVEGTEFVAVQAPSLDVVNDLNGYSLVFDGMTVDLAPGELFTFAAPVNTFEILGIDVDLMLDPGDGLAFVTGIALADPNSVTSLSQTPQTVFVDDGGPSPVPLPATGALMLLGLGMFGIRKIAKTKSQV